MLRVLAILSAVALCVGCRTPESNPLAAFGAATIPPPEIEMPGAGGGTYYQAPGSGGTAPAVTPPSNSLPSISVPSGGTTAPQPSIPRPYSFGSLSPAPSSTTPSFTTDPADREPIRVVEAAPSARMATAPPRISTTPSTIEAAPAARNPIRAFNATPPSSGISPYVPTFGQPPANGGFKSSGSFRTGGSVQPAAYHEAVPAFVEQPSSGSGQWRTR